MFDKELPKITVRSEINFAQMMMEINYNLAILETTTGPKNQDILNRLLEYNRLLPQHNDLLRVIPYAFYVVKTRVRLASFLQSLAKTQPSSSSHAIFLV